MVHFVKKIKKKSRSLSSLFDSIFSFYIFSQIKCTDVPTFLFSGAVASMFWVDAELGSDIYLDGKKRDE